MPLTPGERESLIEQYAAGAARLRTALQAAPEAARQWRPAPGKWSIHEIVCHCADAEANAHGRIRYVLAEREPLVVGYDQDAWASTLDYHNHPLEAALATVDAVRANTVALLRRLPEHAWTREGRHTDTGRYTAEDWLRAYAEHVEKHSRQIERTLQAWQAQA